MTVPLCSPDKPTPPLHHLQSSMRTSRMKSRMTSRMKSCAISRRCSGVISAGVEDVDHVPALRLGAGVDVGTGLLDLVVHQPDPPPSMALRLRRRVSAALRDASLRASGL